MRITADLISNLYSSDRESLREIIKVLVQRINAGFEQELSFNRLGAILHILAAYNNDKNAIKMAQKIVNENQDIELNDICSWTFVPGYAGSFATFQEADSRGCGHYAFNQKQDTVLDILGIDEPLQICDLNTRYQRIYYAASLAIGRKSSAKVVDFGGGSGKYYILLRKLFPSVRFDYTCVDFEEWRPLNVSQIGSGFRHVSDLFQIEEPFACDLFIASSVLQYLQEDVLHSINRYMAESRIALIDRTPSTKGDSFWSIQTKKSSRQVFHVFNEQYLREIANLANSRNILAEGICPEDFMKVFSMDEFNFGPLQYFKWFITSKLGSDTLDFSDFVIQGAGTRIRGIGPHKLKHQ